MGWFSVYFQRGEFACPCGCGYDTVDAELLFVLDRIRRHFSLPVRIHSAARCHSHNAFVGGHVNSYHLTGKAADFSVNGIDLNRALNCLEALYADRFGIGTYPNHLHLDIRPERSRWSKL